jgi:diacylglycerol kinase family enzyme
MMFQSKKVKFSFDKPVKWTRDGESGGAHTEVVLENLQSAFNIFA